MGRILEFFDESKGVRGIGPQIFFYLRRGTSTFTRPSTPAAKGRTEAGLGQVGRDGGCPTSEWEKRRLKRGGRLRIKGSGGFLWLRLHSWKELD